MGHSSRIEQFLDIAGERIMRINIGWVHWEQGEASSETCDELARDIHTLKGEAGLMGYAQASKLAHALEELMLRSIRAHEVAAGDIAEQVLLGLDLLSDALEAPADACTPAVDTFIEEVFSAKPSAQAPAVVAQPQAEPQASAASEGSTPLAPRGKSSVRIAAAELDRIRDLLGDIMVSQATIESATAMISELKKDLRHGAEYNRAATIDTLSHTESALRDATHEISQFVDSLGEVSQRLRLAPIKVLFESLPRAVRDLARDLSRQVKLEIAGEGVEVDRDILDSLSDPLLHLLRNAIDHGIESPEERLAAGKSEVGTITLRATSSGSSVIIEVEDDGAGIDVDRVRKKAVESGVLEAPSARVLDDKKVLDFMFASGFSTRNSISQVSGRGVGLDVVRTTIRSLGGAISVDSTLGRGTRFQLRVPVTIAITPLLVFRLLDRVYALPSNSVEGVIETAEIQWLRGARGTQLRFRDQLVPVVAMTDAIGSTANVDRSHVVLVVRGRSGLVAFTDTTAHFHTEGVVRSTGAAVAPNRLVMGAVASASSGVIMLLNPEELTSVARIQAPPRRTEKRSPETSNKHLRILVTEDSPIMRDIIADALRSHGVDVLEAENGQVALETLKSRTDIDLLVTDLEMPEMDGFELIRNLRNLSGHSVPAIVISTRGSDADKLASVQVGADAYLVKSDFSSEALWNLVSRYLPQ